MTSVQAQILKCEGLIDTKDVSDWENGFLKNVVARAKANFAMKRASGLSGPQLETLEKIHNRHFG